MTLSKDNHILIISSKLSELDKLLDTISDRYECLVDDKYITLDNGDFSTVIKERSDISESDR